ncbi:unnamed protein product, partial [Polarella glacialis]
EAPGAQHRALVCLWRSNRVCILIFREWELFEMMLLDETATTKQRLDSPICGMALPNPEGDETFNMVVSYTSMVIRWWQVSLTSCRQQAHIVLTFAVNNLTAIHRP